MSASGRIGSAQVAGGYNAPAGSPFTLGNAGSTGTIDTSTLGRWMSIQITANASANTISWEASDDGLAWIAFRLYDIATGSPSNGATTSNSAAQIVSGWVPAQFVRVRISGFIGGTTSLVVVFHPTPSQSPYVIADTELSSSIATNANISPPTTAPVAALQFVWTGSVWAPVANAQQASDTNAGTQLQGVVAELWTGASFSYPRTPNVVKTALATAAGSTPLWTPGANKKFRAMRLRLEVTDDATQAVGGVDTITLLDSATSTQLVFSPFVPAVALANSGVLYNTGWIDLGNGILSSTANNVLNISLANALTAGGCRVIVIGTEE